MADTGTFWVAFWSVFHEALENGALPSAVVCTGAADGKHRLNPGSALQFAAEAYKYTIEDLLGRSKAGHRNEARALAVWGLRQCGTEWSYHALGRALGGRDHSTIIHLFNKAEGLRERSPSFAGACADMARLFDLNLAELEEENSQCP